MNVITVVQARTRSTRLPGKVLAPFPDGPLLIDAVVHRAEQIGYPVVVTIPHDDPQLASVCYERGWTVAEGAEEDVLARYVAAAWHADAEHVIRITADCPFIDIEAAKWTVEHHLASSNDLTTYHLAEGRGVQVFRAEALERTWRRHGPADSPDQWILSWTEENKVEHMKFSVDTQAELETARRRTK